MEVERTHRQPVFLERNDGLYYINAEIQLDLKNMPKQYSLLQRDMN
jgi:hypothetical protein